MVLDVAPAYSSGGMMAPLGLCLGCAGAPHQLPQLPQGPSAQHAGAALQALEHSLSRVGHVAAWACENAGGMGPQGQDWGFVSRY